MHMLQASGQEHDQKNDQNQSDETATPGEPIISPPIADPSANDSENQNDDENQYERTHDGVLLRNVSAKSRVDTRRVSIFSPPRQRPCRDELKTTSPAPGSRKQHVPRSSLTETA